MNSVIARFSPRLVCGFAVAIVLSALSVSHSDAQLGGRSGRSGRQPPRLLEPGSFLPHLRDEKLLEELEVTDDQRKEIQAIRTEFGQIVFKQGNDDERKQKLKELDARAVKILTPEQNEIWEKRRAESIAKASEAEGGKETGKDSSKETGDETGKEPTETDADAKPTNEEPKSSPEPTAAPEVKPTPPVRPSRNETPPPGAKVTATFSSDSEDADDAATGPDVKLSFNFQYAPWKEVLELFAKKADLTLDLESYPPGTFSYRDSKSYSPTQALDVLNGYLLQRGYLLVRRDRFLACVEIAKGIQPELIPKVPLEELAERGKFELVSVVIPIRGLQADAVIAEVRELLSPNLGKASALKNTNSIVIADLGGNVRRINALLASESAVDTRDTAFKSIPLKHISATEAERMVRRLFGLNSTTTVSGGQPQQAVQQQPQWGGWGGGGWGGWSGRRRGGDRGGNDDQQQDQQQQQQQQQQQMQQMQQPAVQAAPQVATTSSGVQFANKIQVAADSRTNHLLVIASAALVAVVEDAVKEMDTNLDKDGNVIVRVDVPVITKTYTVTGGDIASVSQVIDQIVPGVIIGQDSRTSKLYVRASQDEHDEVAKLISEFSGEGSGSVAVIPILKKDPVTLCNTLLNLYSKETRAPSMEADPVGRLIIVRGTPDQVLQVKTILAQLGEGGEAGEENVDRGNVRTFTLNGRDPDEFLPMLKGSWTATQRNPIRIVVPSRPSPIRERSVPGASRRKPAIDDDRVSERVKPSKPLFRSAALVSNLEDEEVENDDDRRETGDDEPIDVEVVPDAKANEKSQTAADEPSEGDDAQADQKREEVKPAGSPVYMEVHGDQIVVTSDDKEALDRAQELFDQLSGIIPPRTKWHVFYLRTADATEAAQMVERLFPQSNVTASTSSSGSGFLGSLAGGVSSIGRGLMNVSGLDNTLSGSQSLKVVTDIRSNALFVSGPMDQVTEVEQILEVLDASELPQSLRDRMPRSIPVEHADVEEVAQIVEDIFEDAMTPENQMPGGRGAVNPFMMLMGGAQPQPGGRRQPTVQLTVGVDRKTNHLIVSCNDSLFQQIESVVQEYDERAKQSRQTVKVVRLNQADPALVQQTLSSLMPKVTVGSTLQPRRARSDDNQGSQFPGGDSSRGSRRRGGDSNSANDAMREAMMRQMMQGGGRRGSNSDFGDRGRSREGRREFGRDGRNDNN